MKVTGGTSWQLEFSMTVLNSTQVAFRCFLFLPRSRFKAAKAPLDVSICRERDEAGR